jgi:hypothetical protein
VRLDTVQKQYCGTGTNISGKINVSQIKKYDHQEFNCKYPTKSARIIFILTRVCFYRHSIKNKKRPTEIISTNYFQI